MTGLWNRLGESFPGPDLGMLGGSSGCSDGVLLHWALLGSLCATVALSLFFFSEQHPGLASTVFQHLPQLRGMGKRASGGRKGLDPPSWPDGCIYPALSQTKDGNPSISGISFLLLKPHHGHAVGGMEWNSANTSILFLCNHNCIKKKCIKLYSTYMYVNTIIIEKMMAFLIPYFKAIIHLVHIFSIWQVVGMKSTMFSLFFCTEREIASKGYF